jgi:hypothetical protein
VTGRPGGERARTGAGSSFFVLHGLVLNVVLPCELAAVVDGVHRRRRHRPGRLPSWTIGATSWRRTCMSRFS